MTDPAPIAPTSHDVNGESDRFEFSRLSYVDLLVLKHVAREHGDAWLSLETTRELQRRDKEKATTV